jgi:hypothetical protein
MNVEAIHLSCSIRPQVKPETEEGVANGVALLQRLA